MFSLHSLHTHTLSLSHYQKHHPSPELIKKVDTTSPLRKAGIAIPRLFGTTAGECASPLMKDAYAAQLELAANSSSTTADARPDSWSLN
mgnify:CR=1 FL=1